MRRRARASAAASKIVLAVSSALLASCGADGVAEHPTGPGGVEPANVLLTDDAAFPHQEEPSLVVAPSGRIVVAWKEMSVPAGANRIAWATSTDGGASWSVPSLLARGVEGRGQSDPWLEIGGSGSVHLSQWNPEEGGCRVSISTSSDGAASFSPPRSLHDGPGCADKGSLASDGAGTLYAAYHEIVQEGTRVRVRRSPDGGSSWAPSVLVPGTEEGSGLAPVLDARPGGRVWMAWWASSDGDIRVTSSSDAGETWSSGVTVNDPAGSVRRSDEPLHPPLFPPFPSITAIGDGVTVIVAWPERRAGGWDVLASRSTDGGAMWSEASPVSRTSTGNQWMISLAQGPGGTLHAAWYDASTGDTHLVHACSTDGGRTWSSETRITAEASPGTRNRLGDYVGIDVDDDGVPLLAWTDTREGDLDVYFARGPRC